MAAEFHQCPVCEESFGPAVFESHVDLCLKRQVLAAESRKKNVYTPSKVVDKVAKLEKAMFAFLDKLEASDEDVRLHGDVQGALDHLVTSMANAQQRLAIMYRKLGVVMATPGSMDVPEETGGDGGFDYAAMLEDEDDHDEAKDDGDDDEEDDLPPPPGMVDEPKPRRRKQGGLGRMSNEEARLFQEFLIQTGTCNVCKLMKGPEVVMKMGSCGHRMCPDCLRNFFYRKLRSKERINQKDWLCLASSRCLERIPDWMVRKALDPEDYDKLMEQSIQEFLEAQENLVTCPNAECGAVFEPVAGVAASQSKGIDGKAMSEEAKQHRAQFRFRCLQCQTIFCSSCKESPYHAGFTCEQWADYQTAKHCRFCGDQLSADNTAPPVDDAPALDLVCTSEGCAEKREIACAKILPCGHPCCGVRDEAECLPCLEDECRTEELKVEKESFCNICWVESIGAAPCIRLDCGHIFHMQCVLDKISRKWDGARITFGFLKCPLCSKIMSHPSLTETVQPYLKLFKSVESKALQRLKYEKLDKEPDIIDPLGNYYGRPADYAMDRFAYYPCHTCKQPYFGGRRQCEEAARPADDEFKPEELVCGSCAAGDDTSRCKIHGREFIEFKCKFCCSVASFYCWGTTHFCATCHKRQEQGDYLTRKNRSELPKCPGRDECPLGVDHPPNGEEFILGCGICRQRPDF